MKKYTDEFLLSELKRYYKENSRNPTAQDFYLNEGYPSFNTYQKRFKTWNNALELAGLNINKIDKLNGNEVCFLCSSSETYSSWHHINNKRICDKCYDGGDYLYGELDPNSTLGLGVISEYVVYKVLGDCINCNHEKFHSKYDLISNKYKNINVKSSKLCERFKSNLCWDFTKHRFSTIPDNYICIGFDETRSKILHVWIIPGNSILVKIAGISITNSDIGLERFHWYEVDAEPYNKIYQNLDIHTLPEFKNLTS